MRASGLTPRGPLRPSSAGSRWPPSLWLPRDCDVQCKTLPRTGSYACKTSVVAVPTIAGALSMDAIAILADHVVTTQLSDLPSEVIGAAKIFILDTFGVGLAGSSEPLAAELVRTCAIWGHNQDARVWGSDTRLPAPTAAMCNATQVHNSEFDCLHEGAVVHAMSVVLPAAMAGAERKGDVSGIDLIVAISVGVD